MAEPLLKVWKEGRPVNRIHPVRYASTEFNATGKGHARFSPLVQPDGTIIATMYGADTFRAAAMETVFHDLPDDIAHFIFDYKKLHSMALSVIEPMRDLQLLELSAVGLKPMRLKRADIVESPPSLYWQTQQYALGWHNRFPNIDGLYWISKQDGDGPACMLFGDRVSVGDLAITSVGESLQASPQMEKMVNLAKLLGITKGRNFPSGVVGF